MKKAKKTLPTKGWHLAPEPPPPPPLPRPEPEPVEAPAAAPAPGAPLPVEEIRKSLRAQLRSVAMRLNLEGGYAPTFSVGCKEHMGLVVCQVKFGLFDMTFFPRTPEEAMRMMVEGFKTCTKNAERMKKLPNATTRVVKIVMQPPEVKVKVETESGVVPETPKEPA